MKTTTAVKGECAVFDTDVEVVYTDKVLLEMTRTCSKTFDEIEQELRKKSTGVGH